MMRRIAFGLCLAIFLALGGSKSIAQDVVWLDPQRQDQISDSARLDLPPLASGRWQGDVFVLPYSYGGSYDATVAGKQNYDARYWLSRSFLADNVDGYDFVVIVPNFVVNLGADVAGTYWHVRNDIQGIGLPIGDSAYEFGSKRLQGYIDILGLGSWVKDDGSFDEAKFLLVLNHELAHRWSAHCHFKDSGGQISSALLGRDGSHWSYLLDSDASFLYGSKWVRNADGTYTAAAVEERFSQLDLYLMGMLAPAEVAPFTLLVNPAIGADQLPRVGDKLSATPQTISIDQVIAAQGQRNPAAGEGINDFRVAFIYALAPGTQADPKEVEQLQRVIGLWRGQFFKLTAGRGLLDPRPQGPVVVPGATLNLTNAANWLVSHQTSDGSWRDSPLTVLRDTAEAVHAVSVMGGNKSAVDAGVVALGGMAAGSTELLSVQLDSLANRGWNQTATRTTQLLDMQDTTGGWGSFPRYSSDPVTTAVAIQALVAAGVTNEAQRAWTWLTSVQTGEGGWRWQSAGPSAVYPTLEALLAARSLTPQFLQQTPVQRAYNWLTNHQPSGGFGEPNADIPQTAMYLSLVEGQSVDQTRVQQAVDFLSSRQSLDGSWEASVHKTALALASLGSFLQPDPSVLSSEMYVIPDPVYEGDQLTMTAGVRNRARDLAAGTAYRWELVVSGSIEVAATLSGALPAIGSGSPTTVTDYWTPKVSPGFYRLRIVIDPGNLLAEKDETNNVAEIALRIKGRAQGVDLSLAGDRISVTPASISQVGQVVSVSGVVTNLGKAAASGALIGVFDGPVVKNVLLGSIVVNVPALGEANFSIIATLPEVRPYTLTIAADPSGQTGDEDTSNNEAKKHISVANAGDLEVEPGSFLVQPVSGAVGDPLALRMRVHNRGTLTAENVQVAFLYRTGNPPQDYPILLQTLAKAIPPNASEPVEVTWRPNVTGSPLEVVTVVDPQELQSDINRSNNRASLSVTINPSPLPNLEVNPASFSFSPAKPLQAQNCRIAVAVTNHGINPADGFAVELRLDNADTGQVIVAVPMTGLAAGATTTVEGNWLVEGSADRLIYVVVDRADTVHEFNEDDNRAFRVLDVQSLPDLLISNGEVIITPAFPFANQNVGIDAVINNVGDQPAIGVKVELVDGQGVGVGTQYIARLEPHSRTAVSFNWTASAEEGEVQLKLCANPQRTVVELRYDNNDVIVPIAVQSSEIYVSERYFSPNGDGVKDSVNVYFNKAAAACEVVDDEGEIVRTIPIPVGNAMVTWDGRNNEGSLAPDGFYLLRVGSLVSWTILDTNLLPISSHPSARWLTGSLQGEDKAQIYFGDSLLSPADGEVYAIKWIQDAPGGEQYKLMRCTWEDMVEVGNWPEQNSPPIGASLKGDLFIAGSRWNGDLKIIRYPGPIETTMPWPDGYQSPVLSPDGRFVVWVKEGEDSLIIDSIDNPGQGYSFGPYNGDWSVCDHSKLVWSIDGNKGFIAARLGEYGPAPVKESVDGQAAARRDSSVPYYLLIDLNEQPNVRVVEAPQWPTSTSCWGGGDIAALALRGSSDFGDDQIAIDFSRDRVFYLHNRISGPAQISQLSAEITGPGEILQDVRARRDHETDRFGELDRFTLSTGAYVRTTKIVDQRYCFPLLSNDGRGMLLGPSNGGEGSPQGPARVNVSARVESANLTSGKNASAARHDWCDYTTIKNWITREKGRLPNLSVAMGQAIWSPYDKYIFFPEWDKMNFVLAADNLPVKMQTHVLFGNAGINMWAIVADRYFDKFTLSYADAATPDQFQQIAPASREPLFGEVWGTWLPPHKGKFLVRLGAIDQAGNQRSVTNIVRWNGDNDIANLYLENRYISPRSSPGVKDQLILHYTVLRPANLLFEIKDSNGLVVGQIPVAADVIGDRTSTWDGADNGGHPVPDGRYLVCYLGGVWPFVVDNTPPSIQLQIGNNEEYIVPKTFVNGLVNPVFASLGDVNLDKYSFEARTVTVGIGSWIPLDSQSLADERESNEPFTILASDFVAGREFRINGFDLAGNSAVVQRVRRQEQLIFAESEPRCRDRKANPHCEYLDRPTLDKITDRGEKLITLDGEEGLLHPDYDTLVLQSSIWGMQSGSVRLEYRPVAANGTPVGVWQRGSITVAQIATCRRLEIVREFTTGDAVGKIEKRKYDLDVSLFAVYWDHSDLPMRRYQVRLIGTNLDGQEISSPIGLFKPVAPLIIEYLGTDQSGPHFRVTNLGNEVARNVVLESCAQTSQGGCTWQTLASVIDQLPPANWANYSPGCVVFGWPSQYLNPMTIRAKAASTDLVFISDSLSYETPGAAVFSSNGFQASDCSIGVSRTQGIFATELLNGEVDQFFSGSKQGTVGINVPKDPAGAVVQSYDLLLDGVVVASFSNPSGLSHSVTLDLAGLSEGTHVLKDAYTYKPGEQGFLGNCEGSKSLIIDRTPPSLEITSPKTDDLLCPEDGILNVEFPASDSGSGLYTGAIGIDGWNVARCIDKLGRPIPCVSWKIDLRSLDLPPGEHVINVTVWDRAGNSSCEFVRVYVEEQPAVGGIYAAPALFSPINVLGRPTLSDINFVSKTPANYTLQITPQGSNTPVRALSGEVKRGERIHFAWDGSNALGQLVPDGDYRVKVGARTSCGALALEKTKVTVDTTPPTIEIISPKSGTVVGASLEITGKMFDLHPEFWKAEVRAAEECPTCWHEVALVSRRQTESDSRLGIWETAGYKPGDYFVRVVAVDVPGNQREGDPVPVRLRERHFIDAFNVEPALFSPNGDTLIDEVDISFHLIQDALITLRIIDSQGITVRTLRDRQLTTAAGAEEMLIWNGAGDGGGTVPDGVFTVELKAEDPKNPPELDSEVEKLSTTSDITSPVLLVHSIEEGGIYGLPLDLNASLTELHPDSFIASLIFTGGAQETLATGGWSFASRRIAVLDDIPDGKYEVQIEAFDLAANTSVISRSFTVDNTIPGVVITKPASGTIVNTIKSALALQGTIKENNLVSYAWSYAPGNAPAPGEFREIFNGTLTTVDGEVGFDWDASYLVDGTYTIRLFAIDKMGLQGEGRTLLTVDNTPPDLAIVSPEDGAIISEPPPVTGRVTDANLVSWKLWVIPQGGEPILPALAGGSSPATGTLASWTPLPLDGFYTIRLEAVDITENQSSLEITVQVAAEPPSPPVSLAVSLVNRRDAVLTWQPASGSNPAGCNVYRDGVRINLQPLKTTTLTDPALAEGIYTYVVRAINIAGRESGDSNSVSVTVNLTPPLAKISQPLTGSPVSGQVRVVGTAYKDQGFKEYRLWLRPLPTGEPRMLSSGTMPVLADLLGVWNTFNPVTADGQYEIKLEAEDIYGNSAIDSVQVTLDSIAPIAPVLTNAFSYAGDLDSEINDIQVDWKIEPQPFDLAGFYLYRNGQLANAPGIVVGSIKPYLINATTYRDRNLPDGTYIYYVTAADTAGNESAASNLSLPIVIETGRPHAEIINPDDGIEFDGTVLVEALCSDNDVVWVQFEEQLVGQSVWTSLGAPVTRRPYTVTFNPAGLGTYRLRAIASDAIGPDPAPEFITIIATVTVPAPSAQVDGKNVTITWPPLANIVGRVKSLNIYRNGTRLNTSPLLPTTTSYADSNVANGDYEYTLTAIDQLDHETKPSAPAQARVLTLKWNFIYPIVDEQPFSLSGNGAWLGYSVELQRRVPQGSFETVATIIATEEQVAFDNVQAIPGFNIYRIIATDQNNNRSCYSEELVLARPQTPPAPTNLTGNSQGLDVNLTWAAEGDSESAGFRAYRDGVLLNEVAGTVNFNSTTHTLTGSSGAPAELAFVVDGNPATVWSPATMPNQENPAFWQWTWPTPANIEKATINWGSNAAQYQFEIDVLIEGQWLWFDSPDYFYYPNGTLQAELPINLSISGFRLRLPAPAMCGGLYCLPQLAEISLTTLARTTSKAYTEVNVGAGVFSYGVSQMNHWGMESDWAYVQVLVGVTPPEAPRNLVARLADSCSGVELSWLPPDPLPAALKYYYIYRLVAGESERVEVGTVDAGQLSFYDRLVETDNEYHYWVTAWAEVSGVTIESGTSNETVAQLSCPNPTPPVINQPTISSVPILWSNRFATIGGIALPGSQIKLLGDGEEVGSHEIEVARDYWLNYLPGYGVDSSTSLSLSFNGQTASYGVGSNGDITTILIASVDGEKAVTIEPVTPVLYDPVLSRDGQLVAYVGIETDHRSDLYLHDLTGGIDTRLTDDLNEEYEPTFSPDARYVAFISVAWTGDRSTLAVIDQVTNTRRELLNGLASPRLANPIFTPDGQKLLVRNDTAFKLVNLASGETQDLALGVDPIVTTFPFSPDSRFLVYADIPGDITTTATLWRYDLSTKLIERLGSETGEFAPAYVDNQNVVFLKSKGGDLLDLVSMPLSGGTREILLQDYNLSYLPQSGGTMWDLFANGTGWVAFPQGQSVEGIDQAHGRFSFPNVALHTGRNIFTARQETKASSVTSEAIEINVPSSAFADIQVDSLKAVPAYPLTNQQVVIEGVIRNAGGFPLENVPVILERVGPDAKTETILTKTVTQAPGQTSTIRYVWNTGANVGDSTFVLIADRRNLIDEGDETNNAAQTIVAVRSMRKIEVGVTTDHTEYNIGNPVQIGVSFFSNSEPKDYTVATFIEDAQGNLVDTVDTRPFKAFGGSTVTYSLAWTIPEIYPGPYRVHVAATSASGVDAEAMAVFTVAAPLFVEARVGADKATIQLGSTLNIAGRVANKALTHVTDLAAVLAIEPQSTTNPVASHNAAITTIAAGSEANLPWTWPAAGIQPGRYTVTLAVRTQSGAVVAMAKPFPITVTPAPVSITGALDLVPTRFEPGQNLTVRARTTNVGLTGIDSGDFTITLVDPATGQVIAQNIETTPLPIGSGHDWQHVFSTTGLALQSYIAILSGRANTAGGPWQDQLATVAFTLSDLTPPDVAIIAPTAGLVCDQTLHIRVTATDFLSGVFQVTYTLDGADQKYPLSIESLQGPGNLFATTWDLQVDQQGPHHISVQAEDFKGNISAPVEVAFTVDFSPPSLTVQGPDEAACLGLPTAVTFASSGTVAATLNDQPYVSGATITTEGRYELIIRATNACGKENILTRHFALAWTPATADIAFPAEAACARPGAIPIITINPTGLAVAATLDGQPYTLGVPVTTTGEHTLAISTTDFCGRPGPSLTRHFTIDATGPRIDLAGVDNGFCYQEGVTPTYSITDTNLITSGATLNGQPYASATPITGEGDYALVISGADACGNRANRYVSFVVDRTPPEIAIRNLDQGRTYANLVTPDIVATDTHLADTKVTLDGQSFDMNASIGAIGEHTLDIEAIDCAGNASQASVTFTIVHLATTRGSSATRAQVLFLDTYPTSGASIASWLTSQSITYSTVTTACAFIDKLRGGQYDAVVIHDPQAGHTLVGEACLTPRTCPAGTDANACQQLQRELAAFIYGHGSVLLIGDAAMGEDCIPEELATLGSERKGETLASTQVTGNDSIITIPTGTTISQSRHLTLGRGFATLLTPSAGATPACDALKSITLIYTPGPVVRRPRRRFDRTDSPASEPFINVSVSSPLLTLDREEGNPSQGQTLDAHKGEWASIAVTRTTAGFTITIASTDQGALPPWLRINTEYTVAGQGSTSEDQWIATDCSATPGQAFSGLTVAAVKPLAHASDQKILAAAERYGLGLGATCPWDVARNTNDNAWTALTHTLRFVRPEQERPAVPGGIVPVTLTVPYASTRNQRVRIDIAAKYGDIVDASDEPVSSDPLAWEFMVEGESERQLTFWVRCPEEGPGPVITATLRYDDSGTWTSLEPITITLADLLLSREAQRAATYQAVLDLLKLSLPEGHQPVLENVSEILAGLDQAPAATKADAECALSSLTRAYSLLDGLKSHEVAPIQLRVSRLIESWQAVWSTRGQ